MPIFERMVQAGKAVALWRDMYLDDHIEEEAVITSLAYWDALVANWET